MDYKEYNRHIVLSKITNEPLSDRVLEINQIVTEFISNLSVYLDIDTNIYHVVHPYYKHEILVTTENVYSINTVIAPILREIIANQIVKEFKIPCKIIKDANTILVDKDYIIKTFEKIS